jgi:hypothetical protein
MPTIIIDETVDPGFLTLGQTFKANTASSGSHTTIGTGDDLSVRNGSTRQLFHESRTVGQYHL